MTNFTGKLRILASVLLLLVVTLTGWTGCARADAGVTIWAAQDGQGTTCSHAAPCSLTTAQAQADVLAPTIRGDVTVYLLAGLYRLRQPLTFTAHDSGVHGHNIIYAGYTTPPIISGSIAIHGWSLANSAQNIWSAPVPASLTTRQLYVNGVRAQIAQGNPPVTLTQDAGHAGFTASSDAMASWRNPSNLEFVFPGGDGAWTEPRCRVASMSGTSIIMQQPCWGNTLNRNSSASGGFLSLSSQAVPAHIENTYELLNQPGQWYLDTSLHTLYYIPLPGQDMQQADVEAPVLQTLVQGNGTLDAPVNHLIFRNLQFSYATWLGPDSTNGFSEMQANYFLTGTNAGQNQGFCEYVTPAGSCPFASWAQTPANVTFSASQDVQFDSDMFTHLGGAGLGFQHGSQNNLVINSEFTDISGSGLQLGNDNDPHPLDVRANNREITSSNTIKDNWFHNVATEYHGGVGIFVGYAQHTLITHNQLNDLPYSGISFGWGGWNTNATHQTAETNVNAYNVISYNVIFDYTRTLADGGGVYTNGRQGTSFTDGLQEIGNILFDQHNSSNAFYNDGGSAYVTLKGNAEWSGQTAWGGCSAVGHFRYENNYQSGGLNGFGGCQTAMDITTSQNTHIDNPPASGKVPATLLASAGIESPYTSLVMPGGPQVVDYGPDTGTTTAATNVQINGTGFTPGDTVLFSGVMASKVTVLSPNVLIATLPSRTNLQIAPTVSINALAAYFNNTGVSNNSNPSQANFDTSGDSYSAQALAAVGATSGATLLHHGLSFTWPNVAAGSPDNVVAQGQRIAVSGSGDTLGFLLAGVTHTPSASGTGTIVYSGGLQQSFTLYAPNWYFTSRSTGDQMFVLPYHNSANRPQDRHQVVVYYAGIPLQSNAPVAQVILPNLNPGPLSSLHIFAMSLGYQALATAYNNTGVSNNGSVSPANFDSFSYSYSAQTLAAAGARPGATILHHGLGFTWPKVAAGNPDNVVAQGQRIAISGRGNTLGFLLTGVTPTPPVTGSGTVIYSNGSQQSFMLSVPNWECSSGDQVLMLSYRNASDGTADQNQVCVYFASVALRSTQTVAQVILPDLGPDVLPSLHIFAISLGNSM